MGDGGLNCGYFCSKPGIFKLITIIIGIISAAMISMGYTYASTSNGDSNGYFYKPNGNGYEDSCKTARTDKPTKPLCPIGWLVLMSYSIMYISWIVSLIVFLILLCVQLNKNGLFQQLDFIGHLIGGLFQLTAGVLVIVFVAMALSYTHCANPTYEDEGYVVSVIGGVSDKETCTKRTNKSFSIIYFSIAGGLAIVNTIVHFITGPIIKKEKT